MPLDTVFAPRSIVLFGGEDRRPAGGRSLADRLAAGGYRGELHLVGASGAPRLVPSESGPVPVALGPFDLVVLAGDPRDAVDTAAAWIARGAQAILVTGDPRVDLERPDPDADLVAACAGAGVRLVGPRSAGFCAPGHGLALLAEDVPVTLGSLALATSAGPGTLNAALRVFAAAGVGIREAIDLGAAHDLALPELLARWERAPEVHVAALHGLATGRPAALVAAVRAFTRVKPLLVAGPDAADLALVGAVPVASIDALGVLAAELAPRASADRGGLVGRGVAVITVDAALAAHARASVLAVGFTVPPLAAASQARLAGEVHAHARLANPVDLLPVASPRHLREAADIAAQDPAIAAIAVVLPLHAQRPVLPATLQGKPVVVGTPDHVAAALDALRRVAAAASAPPPGPTPPPTAVHPQLAQAVLVGAHLTGRTALSPEEARRVLKAYGMPHLPALTVAAPHAARRAASELGYPVAVTLRADGRSVRAGGLADGAAVEAAVLRLYAEAGSTDPRLAFDLQPSPEPEPLTLEAHAHPRLGHRVGLRHGCTADHRWLPLTAADARSLAEGVLGVADAGLRDAAADLLLRLARLVTDLPEIAEAELGPWALHRGRWSAVDAALAIDRAALLGAE